MNRSKPTPDGEEISERIDVSPVVPPKPEELAGGGGGTADEFPVPPDQGGGVEVENWLMNLPNHPRGEGWLK